MPVEYIESDVIEQRNGLSRTIALIAAVFGLLAFILACIGMGAPSWETYYNPSASGPSGNRSGTVNFFYACLTNPDGSGQNCTYRSSSLSNYGSILPYNFNDRLDNAASLSIIGIALIFSGVISTVIMAFVRIGIERTLIAPIFLFLACLFMLAGLAEGSRVLHYNDYAANLYETAHLLTMLSLLLCSIAAGRYHASYIIMEPIMKVAVSYDKDETNR